MSNLPEGISLVDLLALPEIWEAFYEYKSSLAAPRQFTQELRPFIERRGYLGVCERIRSGEGFPLPRKAVISKMSSQKKRIVYVYPYDENMVLKLLTFLLLRKYDGLFADGLYSFRPGRSAKDAIRKLIRTPRLGHLYSYKADIHNYFNSVPVERFLPLLKEALSDDPRLYAFLSGLLREPCVLENGKPVEEQKGIMAGIPLASFYANLYLSGLDRHFAEAGVPYARYSDDIILFAPSEEEARAHAEYIHAYLAEHGLEINPEKESFSGPEDGFSFLGFSCCGGTIDIAPATLKKLRQKMRRKRDALLRWQKRNGRSGEDAAKAFVRVFNRKLLENARDNDLTWSQWFFSVITTSASLHEIDVYAQDCLRVLLAGTHTKKRFRASYEDLKSLGYRNLVHEYYAYRGKEQENGGNSPDPYDTEQDSPFSSVVEQDPQFSSVAGYDS